MKHPYQIITADSDHIYASVKNHLQAFDTSGTLLGSWIDTVDTTTPLKKHHEELAHKMMKTNDSEPVKIPKIPTPGPGAPRIYNYIRALVVSPDGKYLVGSTDSDKSVIVFKLDFSKQNCLELIKRQVFPKRPCSLSIDSDNNVIVADKFGDVYAMDMSSDPIDEKLLVPILGHVSMLSDVLVTELGGKKYVLSGDRDEHIRVTHFPKSYVVKHWLFGHKEFVSAMAVPGFEPEVLISGGGDDFLSVWRWCDNQLVQTLQLRPHVEELLSDNHLPPERFRTEESVREITVSKIVPVSVADKKYLVVLIENTSALVVFSLGQVSENYAQYAQTLKTSSPVVSVCLAGDKIVASLEDGVEVYAFGNEGLEVEKKLDIDSPCDVDSKEEFYPLYQVSTLRKRSDH